MKRKADVSNINNAAQNEPKTARTRADSFQSLLSKLYLPDVGEDILLSPQELKFKEIEAQFKSEISNLTNNRNKKLLNLFGSALKENDTETCEKIINSDHFDVNTQDDNGYTALHYSSRLGKDEVTRLLINKGADIRIKTRNGNNALHVSTFYNHIENSDVLIVEATKKDLIVDMLYDKNNMGFTPINYSESHTFINYVKHASEYKESESYAPIKEAYDQAKDDILLDLKDKDGNTALHYATANDAFDTAMFLMQNGARADIENNKKQTPKDLVSKNSKFTFGSLFRKNNLQKGPKSQQR